MENITIRRFKESDAKSISELVRRNSLEVNIKDYPKEKMEDLISQELNELKFPQV